MDGFSIVIPVRFASGAAKFCYETLKKHSKLDHEYIFVCDRFTSWQHYKWLQENNIFYYENGAVNWYANMNYGASKATKEYIAFFQDDLLVSQDWDINLAKYLNHNVILTPTYLQGWQIQHDFGFTEIDNKHTQDDFRMDEFNAYCKEYSKEGMTPDIHGFFPEVIARDTFFKLGGYTTFTKAEKRHIHHEDFLKWRLHNNGGGDFVVNSSFAYHFPNIFRDHPPLYGLEINQQGAHYPLVCKKCGYETAGDTLSEEETNTAGYWGYYVCSKCR